MFRKTLFALAAATTLYGFSFVATPAEAAPVAAGPSVAAETGLIEQAQYYGPPRRYYGPPRRYYGPPRYYGPRRYYGPPRFYGPPPPLFVPPVPFYGPRYYY